MAITFTSNLDLKNNRVTNMATPVNPADAVTKQYADAIATGLSWKNSARCGSDVDVTVSSPGTIDGVVLASGDRVLLFGQTDATQNGIYAYDGSALIRATDADDPGELKSGTAITIAEGVSLGNHTYVLTTDDPITIGTTPQSWSLLNAGTAQVYTEGDGIDITSNTISVVAAPNAGLSVGGTGVGAIADPAGGVMITAPGFGLNIAASAALSVDASGLRFVPRPNAGIDVDATGAGVKIATDKGLTVDASGISVLLRPNDGLDVDATGIGITTDPVGALATSATGIAVVPTPNSGIAVDATGVSTVLDTDGGLRVDNLGLKVLADPNPQSDPVGPSLIVSATGVAVNMAAFPAKFAQSLGDGAATTFAVVHNMNSLDVMVDVYEVATGQSVFADITRTDANTISVDFGSAPASGQYRAVVLG